MTDFTFYVGLELTNEQLIREIEKYEKKEGVKLHRGRTNTFESVNVKKPVDSNLPYYSIELECQYAGENKNKNQIAIK